RSSPCPGGPSATSSCRCSPTATPGSSGAGDSCRSSLEESLRPDEHHRDEEGEGDDVAPLDGEEEAAHRDELREDERGDQAANHAAQAAEHADEKDDRAERKADR